MLNNITRYLGFVAIFVFSMSCTNRITDLVVMTFHSGSNVFCKEGWINQKKEIVNSINQFSPEIIGLQGIGRAECYALTFDLNSYQCVTDEDNTRTYSSVNPIYFKLDQYELITKARLSLNSCTHNDSVKKQSDYLSWIKLREKKTGFIFYVFNANFANSDSLIAIEVPQLAEKINEIVGDAPLILFGNWSLYDTQCSLSIKLGNSLESNYSVIENSKALQLGILTNQYFKKSETSQDYFLTKNPTLTALSFDFN